MFNISSYFKKFVKIEGDSVFERDVILSVFNTFCGTQTVGFEIRKNIIYIKGSSVLKSILFTKKIEILKTIQKKLPQSNIVDIR